MNDYNKGRITVVGIGPGEYDQMSLRAARTLADCDVIVGYTVYIDLIREYFPGKVFLTTPMTREKERCALAFREAEKGQLVGMVCSGDAGVYGMAGLMYQLGQDYPEISVETVPGVTAALAGAALLGAPLIHDFAVISLSDRLTPWEKIERRLSAAAEADFVVVLYNPSSRLRPDYLRKACDLLLRYKSPDTVCGTARNIGRDGEETKLYTLAELRNVSVDMFTTVFVGNAETVVVDGRMVTPRGYGL